MSFTIERHGGAVRARLGGELTITNRQELRQAVLEELERGERRFLIDFSETGYVDSSGLGVLVSVSKKIREHGGDLRLANLNDDLKTLFELTKLDTLFQIEGEDDGRAGRAARSHPRPPGPLYGGAERERPNNGLRA